MRIMMVVALLAGGCSKPAMGTETGPCYGNGTCNVGLVCQSDVCVRDDGADLSMSLPDMTVPGDGSMSQSDLATADFTAPVDLAQKDASKFDDGGIPCPGAAIWHPGSETRKVNTSVPFVGRGRDPNCAPITGANLVWSDSLEGQIGTGESFSFTFTMVGMHTVTLAVKDGANTYYAWITFIIEI
jgi:hypothetical protein